MLYSTSYIKSTRCFDFIIMYHKKCSPVSLISSAGFSSACNQWTKPLQLHLHMMMFFKQLSTETSVCLSQTLSQSSVWKVDILISRQQALHLIWLPWQNPILNSPLPKTIPISDQLNHCGLFLCLLRVSELTVFWFWLLLGLRGLLSEKIPCFLSEIEMLFHKRGNCWKKVKTTGTFERFNFFPVTIGY